MVEIIDITGRKGSFKCLACAITNKEIEDPFGFITVTKNFRVAHDFEYPIPGFIILSSWKHFQSIDEISSGERKEFIELLYNLRTALREVLSIKTIYIILKFICRKPLARKPLASAYWMSVGFPSMSRKM